MRIQRVLTELYDVELDASIEDFVCTKAVAKQAVGANVDRREVLVIAEEADGISVGLYVDHKAVRAIQSDEDHWMNQTRFDACCLATEGVSHFVYLMFRAINETPVSQLELELQAEIDKYVTALVAGTGLLSGNALLAGNGVMAIRARSAELRQRLFWDAEFVDAEDTLEGERYRLANRLAAQYTEWLEGRFVNTGDFASLARELRRFYRLGSQGKLEASAK